ncbi:MAG: sigma-54-dependent Fis family transcriptional regulator [Flavobacteriales bacterium]|nr:sigma-54-dependent Fis family transcriptional regulator [Flavobacteriales bacterium]
MPRARILIVDDDQDLCLLLGRFLVKNGYSVESAGKGARAKELITQSEFDLVLCDHRLPDTDGLQMVQFIRANAPGTVVIIITGHSEVRLAVEIMRHGAFDYIGKPLYPDELLMRVQDALASAGKGDPGPKVSKPNGNAESTANDDYVEGDGAAAEVIAKHIALVAPTDMTVLIVGETGTGKEFVAKRIHGKSGRTNAPFVAVDCGALPKDLAGSELFGHIKGAFTGAIADRVGSFEQAQGGTLFLDEVGNLSHDDQMKLLRVLQERKIRRIGSNKDVDVDVRILAATNEDLSKAVAKGRFREDLLHRINEFTIHLLPLRQRKEEIPRFVDHFVKQANVRLGRSVVGFDKEAFERIMDHVWSGNLRELGNVIKRAVLLSTGERITADCLPATVLSGGGPPVELPVRSVEENVDTGLRDVAHQAERAAILTALERNGFNRSRTAEQLNIDRKTLYNKIKAFGLER